MVCDCPLNFLSLFAGIGGIDLGLERAGMKCVAQVEIDPFCRRVLAKHWPDVPRLEDVRTVNRESLSRLGTIDLIAGGFPCQDISSAGEGAGIDAGERSGLWREFYRLICEIRPRFALVENVAALTFRGLDRVLGDLAEGRYDAEWACVPAAAVGAPHHRERIFIVAYPQEGLRNRVLFSGPFNAEGLEQEYERVWAVLRARGFGGKPPADFGRLRAADGLSARLGEISAYGNAVVPQVAEWIGRRIIDSLTPVVPPDDRLPAKSGGEHAQ